MPNKSAVEPNKEEKNSGEKKENLAWKVPARKRKGYGILYNYKLQLIICQVQRKNGYIECMLCPTHGVITRFIIFPQYEWKTFDCLFFTLWTWIKYRKWNF
jgi:hypothetical protein